MSVKIAFKQLTNVNFG